LPKRDIGIILDRVFNHTSTNHAWFRKAISGDKRYQDYYFFRSGKAPGVPPTNWASKFGGSAWKYVLSLDKWYLHLFSTEQADLNWDNIEVREALKNVLRFWQRKGVVGFRFDVINLVSKPDSFQDDLGGGMAGASIRMVRVFIGISPNSLTIAG
jgi:trehalose-6-phosphate hydrolase